MAPQKCPAWTRAGVYRYKIYTLFLVAIPSIGFTMFTFNPLWVLSYQTAPTSSTHGTIGMNRWYNFKSIKVDDVVARRGPSSEGQYRACFKLFKTSWCIIGLLNNPSWVRPLSVKLNLLLKHQQVNCAATSGFTEIFTEIKWKDGIFWKLAALSRYLGPFRVKPFPKT